MLDHDILEKLKNGGSYTASRLSGELKEKIAGIRRELAYLESVLPAHGARLTKKRGRGNGYVLTIEDADRFGAFCNELKASGYKYDGLPQSRVELICEKLLNSKSPIKSEQLAEELIISGRQLNNDLRIVRNLMRDFGLEIRNRAHYGMSVEGREFDKRLCLANLYMRNYRFDLEERHSTFFNNAENEHLISKIRRIILEEARKYNIQFSDVALENLIIHLFIIVKRPFSGESEEISFMEGTFHKEMEITRAIVERISEEFSVAFNSYDFQYIMVHIAGKRAYLADEISLIPNEANELTDELLEMVDKNYMTRFSSDENLKLRLQLHFAPLLIRIRNGITSINPLADEVKVKYAMSYEISMLAYDLVERKYGFRLTTDELAYIAMHFELAMYEVRNKKFKVLLVCHTGTCSSEILKQQVMSRFGDYISLLENCSMNMVEYMGPDNYDFIFSTVPLKIFTKTPVHIISDFLDDRNVRTVRKVFEKGDSREETIRKFFPEELFMGEISGETKEEIIEKMYAHIRKYRRLPANFYQQVMEREELSPTDYGNSVAIPHPMHMDDSGRLSAVLPFLKNQSSGKRIWSESSS